MKLGLSLGANVPMGDLGDGVKLGYGISGLLAFQPAALPFGLRAEVGYDRFAVDVPDELKDFYDDVSVVKGLLNAVVKFPGEGLSPYVMGGIGIFRSSGGGSGSTADQRSLGTVRRSNESSTDFGFDLGGGINFQLSGFASFLEATYTSVRGDGDSSEYIPVRFGVMFPIGGGGTTTGGNK
ncbi:MAG: outer membrane beta-barrel protein [Gemmatimonadaceae bacterium]